MKKLNQKGFSHLEVILLIVVLVLVGGSGFYYFKNQKKHDTKATSTQAPATNSSQPAVVTLKEYKNTEHGFSFQYPSDWQLTTDLKDIGRGGTEGDVAVTSPNGTKVHFGPNFGGKGGDCWDDEANAHTTRTCFTQNVLSVEKLPDSSATNPIYFFHVSLTYPTSIGGQTKYLVFISNNGSADTTTGPSTPQVFIHPYDEISTKNGYLTIQVEGKDDAKSDSAAFFDTMEVKEATPILKSFKILP